MYTEGRCENYFLLRFTASHILRSSLSETMRLSHQVATCICLHSMSHWALCLPSVSSTFDLSPLRDLSAAKQLSRRQDGLELIARPEAQQLDDVPIPDSQTTDETTMGPGNSTRADADPGFLTNPNTTRPEADCRNLRTGRANKCWGELNLTVWVGKWMEANREDCYLGEAFASCFTRLQGFYSLDCTGIKGDACSPPQDRDGFDQSPELFYVMHNIYGTKFIPLIRDWLIADELSRSRQSFLQLLVRSCEQRRSISGSQR